MSRLAALVFSASAHARPAAPTAATAAATLAPPPPPPRESTSILARSSTGNALSAATASAAFANARIASAPAASPPLASATHRRNASAVAGSDAALGSARSFSSIGSNLADANVTAALCGAYANAEDPSSAFAAEFEFEREPPPGTYAPAPVNGSAFAPEDALIPAPTNPPPEPPPPGTYAPAPVNGSTFAPCWTFRSPTFWTMKLTTCSRYPGSSPFDSRNLSAASYGLSPALNGSFRVGAPS